VVLAALILPAHPGTSAPRHQSTQDPAAPAFALGASAGKPSRTRLRAPRFGAQAPSHPPSRSALRRAGPAAPQRIVSLIPALTEVLFAIGAGPQVAAVSSFDKYPAEVASLPRVGALVDPDLERILSLRPDLVLVYGSQVDLRIQLERATVPIFLYQHAGLADVPATIRDLGARVGRGDAAERLASGIEADLAAIRARVAGRPRPRVLIVMGRESGALRGVYASGGVGFIHDMVETAGGDNVYAGIRQQAVQATSEQILALRPDVILELRAGALAPEQLPREIGVWNPLSSIPAVRNKRVVILTDERTVVPGPRVAQGTELIARALHPDAFRD
jgi:iron complex transport system substrate-binding protein